MLKIIKLLFLYCLTFYIIFDIIFLFYGYIAFFEKVSRRIDFATVNSSTLRRFFMKKIIFVTLASLALTLSVVLTIIALNGKNNNATTSKEILAEETPSMAPVSTPLITASPIPSADSSIDWNYLFKVNQDGLVCNPKIEKALRIYPFSEGLFQYCSIYDIEKYIDTLSLKTEESILELSRTLFGENLAETYDICVVRKKKNGNFKRINFSKIMDEYTVHHAGFYPRKDCFELYLQSGKKSITIRYNFDNNFKINKIVIKK